METCFQLAPESLPRTRWPRWSGRSALPVCALEQAVANRNLRALVRKYEVQLGVKVLGGTVSASRVPPSEVMEYDDEEGQEGQGHGKGAASVAAAAETGDAAMADADV